MEVLDQINEDFIKFEICFFNAENLQEKAYAYNKWVKSAYDYVYRLKNYFEGLTYEIFDELWIGNHLNYWNKYCFLPGDYKARMLHDLFLLMRNSYGEDIAKKKFEFLQDNSKILEFIEMSRKIEALNLCLNGKNYEQTLELLLNIYAREIKKSELAIKIAVFLPEISEIQSMNYCQ